MYIYNLGLYVNNCQLHYTILYADTILYANADTIKHALNTLALKNLNRF